MQMISIPQIIIVVLAIFFIGKSVLQFIKKQALFTPLKFFTSFSVWSGILIFALFPNLARTISAELSIGNNLNTLIFIGFVIVFILIFRLLKTIEMLEKNITDLVRENALTNKNSKN